MGTSEAESEIIFDKNEYYLGEKAMVKVIVDNSKCAKDIKSIKFKLHRHYVAKDAEGWQSVGSKYLATFKENGCKSGDKMEKIVEVPIPMQDECDNAALDKLTSDEKVMLKAFSMSVSGKLIQIAYTLKCFVKHDSWNEYGEGKVVSLPIKIVQPPTTIVS